MKFIIVANEFFNIYNFRIHLIHDILKNFTNAKIILVGKFDGFEKKIILDDRRIEKKNINFYSRNISLFYNIKSAISLFFLIIKEKPSIILSYTIKPNLYTLIFKYFFKYKLIITVTGLGELFLNKKKIFKYIFKLFKKILRKADFIFLQNNSDYNLLINYNLNLINKSKIIFGSGVDREKFTHSKFTKFNKISFLFVGRIIKEKGVIDLLIAIIKFRRKYKNNYNFVVIGDTYKENIVFNKYFYHLLKISKVNYIKRSSDICSYVRNSHCIILPSYREGLSKVLIEAMSIGRMIITNDVPGCKDLVTNNYNGYICKLNSSQSLLSALEKVYNNDFKNIKIMGKNSYLKSNLYSKEKVNYEYINLIKKFFYLNYEKTN